MTHQQQQLSIIIPAMHTSIYNLWLNYKHYMHAIILGVRYICEYVMWVNFKIYY